MTNPKLEIGDVVQLKSKSHYMTVSDVYNNGTHAKCIYFVDGMLKEISVDIKVLKKSE